MQTTNIVGLILLAVGISGAIVGVALVAREQPIAWVGIVVGVALMRASYSMLRGAGRRLPAEKP